MPLLEPHPLTQHSLDKWNCMKKQGAGLLKQYLSKLAFAKCHVLVSAAWNRSCHRSVCSSGACWGAGPKQCGVLVLTGWAHTSPRHHLRLCCLPVLAFPLTSCRLNSLNYCCLLQGMTCQKSAQPCAIGARGAGPPRSPPAALPLYKAKKLILQ